MSAPVLQGTPGRDAIRKAGTSARSRTRSRPALYPAVEAEAGEGFSVSVSKENLDLLDADLTVMAPIGIPATDISGDPLHKAVPSVKAGHSLVFDDKGISTAFATDSVPSTGYALRRRSSRSSRRR